MTRAPQLTVVAYHYVRDLPRTRYPRIKGLMLDRFQDQVTSLVSRYEMTTLEAALAFLCGRYQPRKHLCLLTFDDGLKEHYTEVLPILMRHRIQGLFFPATSCLEGRVATVHKIHFLMATLEFDQYRAAFLGRLESLQPGMPTDCSAEDVARAYPWDVPAVGALKYLANYALPHPLRDRIIDDLFAAYFADEASFAQELYVSWDELREMQSHGMLVGGHSHAHLPLSSLSPDAQRMEISHSLSLLKQRLRYQSLWPFAYPYGRYDDSTVQALREAGLTCAFTVKVGVNNTGQNPFGLYRLDANNLSSQSMAIAASPVVQTDYSVDPVS